ncbi:type IX secretion system anionic LPS delivery protein PorZ [Ohtaekwangia koreensis]|uniref:Por secretion system C-terminal sorting domain-containing protein n=1 Tax=Ohtaekwangia koreensis TaxID=688867 RepID=A0A1T5LDI8_9BACT|nr:T9SS type A sorting domain-containing protein [Ohtaekwangia koreensis]SKC74107.1 Por secretion system C-terminal sorting domain-containing protein [Ohtaekwangia koreensis]
MIAARRNFSKHTIQRQPFSFSFQALSFSLLLLTVTSYAQEIPIGTWRVHTSYNSIKSIAIDDDYIFGAATNGIMVLDREDNSITSYSKLSGLSGTTVTYIQYDALTEQLLIAYDDGKIDVIKNNVIKSLDPLANASITGSKKINHIAINNGLAYFAADFGVVVFDLSRAEVKETWRDLGVTGETLKINAVTFKDDSIFLATEKGILAGDLQDNLLDFANYKRFNTGMLSGSIQAIASFNSKVYAVINTTGIVSYTAGNWTNEGYLSGEIFTFLNASGSDLLVGADDNLWKINATNVLTEVIDEKIEAPLFALEENGKFWIGDNVNGLLSNYSGSFQSYLPNGPTQPDIFRLAYADGVVWNIPGGYSSGFIRLGNVGIVDEFVNGVWSPRKTSLKDITDVASSQQSESVYYASFDRGVEKINSDGTSIVYNETNSTLGAANVTAIENSSTGLWVTEYGTLNSLHLLKEDNTWESFAAPIFAARYPVDLAIDLSGYIWMVTNPAQGGGIYVFDKASKGYEYITDQSGSGALPSKNVRSIAIDRDGLVWVGTDIGVAYFFGPSGEAVKPIYESRFLLRDDKVTAIAIDGGNRKWMGTERGVWLFNATGEELIYNFTTANSPLLSNVIKDIAINDKTGEVFFATDKGIISFRSDATESDFSFQSVKIFPNPITNSFNGSVGINGLATDALVKITDISGKLIWQTQASGGTATWNVRDYNGKRAATGIYLVFAATSDGTESVVGKIAVVE